MVLTTRVGPVAVATGRLCPWTMVIPGWAAAVAAAAVAI